MDDLKNPDRPDVLTEDQPKLAEAIISNQKAMPREVGGNKARTDERARIRKTMIASDGSDPNGFERIIGESDLVSINFLSRGLKAADAVCRIRIPGDGGGWSATGFLVAPNLMVTNNHVIASATEASQTECEFGYEHDQEGVLKRPAQFNLAPHEIFFTDVEHDVTFVAVAPYSEGGVPLQRYGYLPLIPLSGKALNGEWITLIQHPNGQPKQIAVRSCQIVELVQEKVPGVDLTKVIHYTTDTEPGSSGAPALNDQWQVVALHHKAVPAPATPVGANGERKPNGETQWLANEGIRVSAILRCLQQKRFQNAGAAATLERLDRGIGMAPVLPAPAAAIAVQEADRAPLPKKTWSGLGSRLGYDPAFLSEKLDLDSILGKRKKFAAKLEGSDAVAVDYLHFSVIVHAERRFAMLTAVNIDGARLVNPGARNSTWRRDIRLGDTYQPDGGFYERKRGEDKVQFSRGHLVRRVDPCWGTKADAQLAETHTFHYTNAAPQVQHYNDVDWGNLEDYVLDRIQTKEKKMTVFTGPVFRDEDPLYGESRPDGPWQIPISYWKIAVIQKEPKRIAAAAFILGQAQYVQALYEARAFTRLTPYTLAEMRSQHIQTTIRTIEHETGLNFSMLRDFDSVSALESTRQTRFVRGPGDIII
jgi:endonuclease G, mitochondrial